MDVNDSDHKPVRCIFSVDIARVDKLIRRQEFGEIIVSNEKIRSLLEKLFKRFIWLSSLAIGMFTCIVIFSMKLHISVFGTDLCFRSL